MDNTAIIARLRELGPLPDDGTSGIDTFPLNEFDSLLQELTEPLEVRHALDLINLGPPADTSSYEVEWALVHAAESISAEALGDILPLANDTEVKRIIEIRLANYYKKRT
ncbi:hypothetical protein IC235_13770 [Hymenobacter sp. BT664]|uniref:Uncharacterized protein n=1 Tax=Hymenobacter montanus TaxID=2771359 RepID=A0A927GK04_9BACT|nr:hypothetical protein [Hymenobacter montanus]MBD2768955.1 hypothetical protein [Hymenobacter montanus]